MLSLQEDAKPASVVGAKREAPTTSKPPSSKLYFPHTDTSCMCAEIQTSFRLLTLCDILYFQVVIKAVHLRPDPQLAVQECCLKVSLLPLRLNIDQDSLLFLFTFANEVSGVCEKEGNNNYLQNVKLLKHSEQFCVN